MSIRNELLAAIAVANGGTVTDPNNRNQLLKDWRDALGGPPSSALTFLSLEEQSSPRLFGISFHIFNITAPAETDGVVFIALVQKKNQGVQLTTIKIDGAPIIPPSDSVSSNPGNQENQLGSFEDKTLTAGAHTVEVSNIDGIEGVSLVAVYYKNYTGFTGNFTKAAATGAQAAQLILGDANWAVTPGKRGLNILFAGGLNSLVSEVPHPDYNAGLLNYGTTDTGTDRFNGRLQTAVDLNFANSTSDTRWTIDWSSAGVDAEVLMLAGELDNE